jgi:hypothetical protein
MNTGLAVGCSVHRRFYAPSKFRVVRCVTWSAGPLGNPRGRKEEVYLIEWYRKGRTVSSHRDINARRANATLWRVSLRTSGY